MNRQATLDNLNKVWETRVLSKMSRSNEARELLEKVAATVAPVMFRRKWKVQVLKEFYPKNDGLLGMNVNRGQSVLVRLRPPHNKNEFYPWEHIIGTMIHELTHMEVGPHNANFYKLMDEIADEVDNDQLKGINMNSVSMTGTGYKLGGMIMTKEHDRTKTAKVAAEAALIRIKRSKLSSGSGQKLSSSSDKMKLLTKEELRKVAAEAALRRIRDDQSCRNAEKILTTKSTNTSKSIHNTSSNSSSSKNNNSNADNYMWICDICGSVENIDVTICSYCSSSITDKNDRDTIITSSTDLTSISDTEFIMKEETYNQEYCHPCDTTANNMNNIDINITTVSSRNKDNYVILSNQTSSSPSSSSSSSSLHIDDMIIVDIDDVDIPPTASITSSAAVKSNPMKENKSQNFDMKDYDGLVEKKMKISSPQTSLTVTESHIKLPAMSSSSLPLTSIVTSPNRDQLPISSSTTSINQNNSVLKTSSISTCTWSCNVCTYLNDSSISSCTICNNPMQIINSTTLPTTISIKKDETVNASRITLSCNVCTYMNDFPMINGLVLDCVMCGHKL